MRGARPPEATASIIRAAGLSVSCLSAGQGEPVVLLHGLGASKSWWRHTVPALAADFRVHALDLPGHGDTAVPPNIPDAGYGARFLLEALDALGLEQTSLVGHSLGGLIALEVAAQAPQRVRRLALVDSAGLGQDLSPALRAATLPVLGELVLVLLGRYRWEIRWEYRPLFHNPAVFTDAMAAEVQANRLRSGAAACLLSMLRLGVTWRGVKREVMMLDRLPPVVAPTLIVWGDSDPLFPVSHGRRAQQGIEGARLEVLAACGHVPQLEQPQRFNELLLSFLREPAPALDARRARP